MNISDMMQINDLAVAAVQAAALPGGVYIGANDVPVKLKKKLPDNVLGHYDGDAIFVKVKQPESILRDTVLHEVLHAIIFLAGLRKALDLDVEAEEKLVVTLSPWILAVLRDNPKLVEFLMENRDREY